MKKQAKSSGSTSKVPVPNPLRRVTMTKRKVQMDDLPAEMKDKILQYLRGPELKVMRQVSKTYNKLCENHLKLKALELNDETFDQIFEVDRSMGWIYKYEEITVTFLNKSKTILNDTKYVNAKGVRILKMRDPKVSNDAMIWLKETFCNVEKVQLSYFNVPGVGVNVNLTCYYI